MRVVAVSCLKDNFAYLLISGTRAVVVDPSEAPPIEAALAKQGVTLAAIWLTHHHWDHVGGVDALVAAHPGLEVVISEIDAAKLKPETRAVITRTVADGDQVALDKSGERPARSSAEGGAKVEDTVVAKVIHNPGHTLGAISFWVEDPSMVFTGDTLFAAGCGRVFEGDPPMMYAALMKLAALPPATLVYFGHEYTAANLAFAAAAEPDNVAVKHRLGSIGSPSTPSTIQLERDTNPFLRAGEVGEFARRREWKNNFK
jgi:hydroxyacylglutathione hydrolase